MRRVDLKGNPRWDLDQDMSMSSQYSLLSVSLLDVLVLLNWTDMPSLNILVWDLYFLCC